MRLSAVLIASGVGIIISVTIATIKVVVFVARTAVSLVSVAVAPCVHHVPESVVSRYFIKPVLQARGPVALPTRRRHNPG